MKIAFTLHQIETKAGAILPGTVAEFSDKDYDEMLALGALREPTDDELALTALGKAHIKEAPAVNPLHAEAEALSIKFSKNISDETLATRITEAKEAAEKAAAESGQTDADVVNL